MKIEDYKYYYFLGIGGIGMSALARYFNIRSKQVYGYDKTSSSLTSVLQGEGINITFDDNTRTIPENVVLNIEDSIIIYTPAIPKDNRQLNYFIEAGYKISKRSEVLGLIASQKNCIAVAGTHGKTTTSSILAHLLYQSNIGCHAFVGGLMSNYNSNFLAGKKGSPIVVEADEFDRSFLTLTPNSAAITSIDADHLDIYGEEKNLVTSFKEFTKRIVKKENLILNKNISSRLNAKGAMTYSSHGQSDFTVLNRRITNGKQVFDLKYPHGVIENLRFNLWGTHNLENAVAAMALALMNGVSETEITESLATYNGVKRRFERIIDQSDLQYIDDYAHHPKEIRAVVDTLREMFPGKKLTGIFQPHLYSRTRDFIDEFAGELSKLDKVILLPIYPAREKPIPGIDSQLLFDKIKSKHKKLLEKSELLDELKSSDTEILVTMGAGDIDRLVEPIKFALES